MRFDPCIQSEVEGTHLPADRRFIPGLRGSLLDKNENSYQNPFGSILCSGQATISGCYDPIDAEKLPILPRVVNQGAGMQGSECDVGGNDQMAAMTQR